MKKLISFCFLITLSVNAQNPPADVPYSYGFESFNEGWDIVNTGTTTNTWFYWQSGDNGIAAVEGNNYAGYFFNDANANAWLMSRKINMSAGLTYAISFQYRGQVPEYTECLKVSIGNSNTVAAQLAGTVLYENSQIQSDQWVTKTVHYIPSASNEYVLGFNVCSLAWQSVLALDDVRINIAVLSTDDFPSAHFFVTPNPTTTLLTIENPRGITIRIINIIDNLGRTIQRINNQKNTVVVADVSNLPAGTYVLHIETENGITRERIIKE